MPRSAAAIQAEIDVLEAFLSSTASIYQSTSADGASQTQITRPQAADRLRELYADLDGGTGGIVPMSGEMVSG